MKLASIECIKNIRKHPNADTLEIGEVLGWQTVIKKNQFKDGDKIIFITIDTIVPQASWSNFLNDPKEPGKPIRIKNIKLRGEYSSGIVLSLKEFPKHFLEKEIGTDVTEDLGVQKYIKELPANLSGENVGEFPSHVASKTDEDNGLNDPELVEQVLKKEPQITITQKLDGSSITIIVKNGEIQEVCSRNLSKKETENSVYWNAARKLSFPKNWSGIVQGELCGNGIQKNPLKLQGIKIFVFQIRVNECYMKYQDMHYFCKQILNCDVVPLVCELDVSSTVDLWKTPLQKLQELADSQKYPNGLPGEGIVVRPSSYDRFVKSRRPLGFKLINRNYKD